MLNKAFSNDHSFGGSSKENLLFQAELTSRIFIGLLHNRGSFPYPELDIQTLGFFTLRVCDDSETEKGDYCGYFFGSGQLNNSLNGICEDQNKNVLGGSDREKYISNYLYDN